MYTHSFCAMAMLESVKYHGEHEIFENIKLCQKWWNHFEVLDCYRIVSWSSAGSQRHEPETSEYPLYAREQDVYTWSFRFEKSSYEVDRKVVFKTLSQSIFNFKFSMRQLYRLYTVLL